MDKQNGVGKWVLTPAWDMNYVRPSNRRAEEKNQDKKEQSKDKKEEKKCFSPSKDRPQTSK